MKTAFRVFLCLAGFALAGALDAEELLVRGEDYAVEVLPLSACGLVAENDAWRLLILGNAPELRFGGSVAAADFDGDGCDDIVVGSGRHSGRGTANSAVWVLRGDKGKSRGGIKEEVLKVSCLRAGSLLGQTVNSADTDGDGRPEAIASWQNEPGSSRMDRLSLISVAWRESSGSPNVRIIRLDVPQSPGSAARVGRVALSAGGDVNGDGFQDVVVGLAGWAERGVSTGFVCVLHGSSVGLSAQPAALLSSVRSGSRLELVATMAGDLNGDGFGDVATGAPGFSGAVPQQGRVEVFLGSPDGLIRDPAVVVDGSTEGAGLGGALCAAGDVNSDGYDDLWVGGPCNIAGEPAEPGAVGSVFLFLGGIEGLRSEPAWKAHAQSAWTGFGGALAHLGDMDGDGSEEIAIGEPDANAIRGAEGRVYLLSAGSGAGLPRSAVTLQGFTPQQRRGSALAGGADVDGDGFADLVMASPSDRRGVVQGGAVEVWFGSPAFFPSLRSLPQSLQGRVQEMKLEDGRFVPALPTTVSRSSSSIVWRRAAVFSLMGIVLAGLCAVPWWVRLRRRDAGALEAARRRVAESLHDEVGPELGRLALAPEPKDPAETSSILRTVREQIGRIGEVVHAGTEELGSGEDTLSLFVERLAREAARFAAETGLESQTRVAADLPERGVSRAVGRHLSLSLKELLYNSLRHGFAKKVELEIVWENERLRITVTDDGQGFNPAAVEAGSQGLRNIRRRTAELRGVVKLDSFPGRSTRAMLEVPL